VVGEFRALVLQRLGSWRWRFSINAWRVGHEGFARQPGFTAHTLKREIRTIKELAQQFARQAGDPAFAAMLARAMDAESATIAKRRWPSPQDSFPVQAGTGGDISRRFHCGAAVLQF